MIIDYEKIKEYSNIFHLTEEFVKYISSKCDNIDEFKKILYYIPEFLDNNIIPNDINNKINSIINLDENEIDFKIIKLPSHICPLKDKDKDCKHCPLYPNNLIPYSLTIYEKLIEFNEETNIQKIIDMVTNHLSNNPKELLKLIKIAQQFDIK